MNIRSRIMEVIKLSLALSLASMINLNVIVPSYIAYYGGTISILGLIYSFQSISRCIARLISGFKLTIFNRKFSLSLSLIVKSLAFIILLISNNIYLILLGMIIYSLGESIENPLFLSSTDDLFAESSIIATIFGNGIYN